jgi:hypothetical protein
MAESTGAHQAEERKAQKKKKALVGPIKEAAYCAFLCLRIFRKNYPVFQLPEFLHGAFGLFLCPHIYKTLM